MNHPWLDIRPAANGRPVCENFAQWFGASKVVSQSGLPLTVFHGTNADIHAFDFSRLGASVDNPTTSFGVYFTEDPQDAASWANRAVERRRALPTQNIIAAHLAIANPVVLPADTFQYYIRTARASTIAKHKMAWRDKGHDGIQTERDGKRWFVAFEPHQIKSALGNSGLFLTTGASMTDWNEARLLLAAQRAALATQVSVSTSDQRRTERAAR